MDINRYALSVLAAVLLAGCGGSQPPIGAPGAMSQSPAIRSAMTGSYLYAADCCGVLNHGDVTVYYPGQTKVARHIIEGAFFPAFVALDQTGTLYVLSQFYAVTEYNRGSEKPSRRIKGLYTAVTLALDQSNNLYVANCYICVPNDGGTRANPRDSITVYRAGQTKLLRTITQGIHSPYSLAFDAAGDLYVHNGGGKHIHPSVTVYAPGSGSVLRTITRGIGLHGSFRTQSLAIDQTGDLFVISGDIFNSEVVEFAPGSTTPLRRITDGLSGPIALGLDALGTLYVANWPQSPSGPGWVSVYAPGTSTPQYRIVAGINRPLALTLDEDGYLYVANIGGRNGRITVYAPDTQTPSRSMRSGRFGEPRALALGLN